MLNLLLSPIRTYFSLFTALALPHYLPLFSSQTYSTRRAVAGEVARRMIRHRVQITTQANLESILSVLKVLIKEGISQPGAYPGLSNRSRGGETDETLEEQGWLARIVHLIHASDNDSQFRVSKRSFFPRTIPILNVCSSYNKPVPRTLLATNVSNTPLLRSSPHV